MQKLIIIVIVFLSSISSYGQKEERFELKGAAKLIATWTGELANDASGVLSCGDQISISTRQIGIYVNVIHNNIWKELFTTGGEDILVSTIIKVYEYDFDSDGQNEIIVVNSPEYSLLTVEVFKYSGGLKERVGKFIGQFDIVLDKNTVFLPFGSQGMGAEYLYKNGSFFELIYHNPDKEE